MRLWCYVGKYHVSDGCLSDYSVQEFESVLEWKGESGKLFEAMKKVGFVHQNSNGIYVHDWQDHAGHLAVFKERARLAAQERWNNYYANNKNKQCYKHATSNAPTIPNHTLPNQPNQLKEKYKKESFDFQLPDWIPKQTWEAYIEMRKSIRKPLKTQNAFKIAIDKLSKLKELGNDTKEVLEQSIFNSWQGLFEVRKESKFGQARRGQQPLACEEGTAEGKYANIPVEEIDVNNF